MNTAKEDDVRTHSRMAFRINMDWYGFLRSDARSANIIPARESSWARGFDFSGSSLNWYEGTGLAPRYTRN